MKLLKNSLGYLFIIATLYSCNYNEAKFIITNNSGFNIDSLRITPDSKKEYISLKKGEEVVHYIEMDDLNSDGSYLICFRNLDTKATTKQQFGYYNKGSQIEKNIMITIQKDTILTKSNFNKF
ncbi:hypothetical protein [Winogradskyella vidalii]|uniref:hypothetical protein n=1 Tax=Winogradskyella vidalii TaxID=2615024 RepID=UPI0015C94460|nr:hypothetical protein [Winogradskyella vidalii]